jgi:hypothetical protein
MTSRKLKHAVTMREALGDARLLGSAMEGPSWATWRVFLIAAMGEKLTATERKVFRTFTGRDREPGQRVEEALYLIGRRGGKDRSAAVLATYLAALVDWSGVLARGERGLVLCVGADKAQAAVQRNYIEGVFDASPMLSTLVANKTADAIELSNGISIEVRAANFRRLRGVTSVAVVASEVAFWQDAESANADVEILTALRPSLATTGGPLILITTPYARRGEVWEIYQRHYGAKGDSRILVAQGTSRDFNPTLRQSVIDRAMERDPAAASAEYLAQFREDIAAFVSREVVESAVVPGRHELAPVSAISYLGFIDPSGGSVDAMTVAISHRDQDGRAVLDAVREVRPPFSPEAVIGEFAGLLKSYGVGHVAGDKFGGEFPVEQFAKVGIRYEQSAVPKSDIYRDLLPLLNSGRVALLDHPRLVAQLCSLERRTARGGRDSIDHPPNAHDDIANAAAGAILLAQGGQAAPWSRESLLIDGKPASVPARAEMVYAVLTVGEREAGVAFFAMARNRILYLVDVIEEALSPALLDRVVARLAELVETTRAQYAGALFASKVLAAEMERRGCYVEVVDEIIREGQEALMLGAAVHVVGGRVKVTREVTGKRDPLGVRGGEDDPLRLAALVGVAVGLDQGRSLGRAA